MHTTGLGSTVLWQDPSPAAMRESMGREAANFRRFAQFRWFGTARQTPRA